MRSQSRIPDFRDPRFLPSMRLAIIAVFTWLLIACGSFLTVRGVLEYRESHVAQDQIARQWQHESAAASPVPDSSANSPGGTNKRKPLRHAPPSGAAVAKLSIPSLASVLYVVEGTSDPDLKRGPGHLTGTALPGEVGNCVIAGHRDTHFRVLKDIHQGDEVILERAGQRFRYRVDSMMIVTPDNTSSLRPTGKPELNLITCYPFQYVGSAPKRFIVHAGLESSSLEASR
jgi:sortase A